MLLEKREQGKPCIDLGKGTTRFEWGKVRGSEMKLGEMGTGGGVVEKEEEKRRPPLQTSRSSSGDPVELCIAVESLEKFCTTPITTEKNISSQKERTTKRKTNLLR